MLGLRSFFDNILNYLIGKKCFCTRETCRQFRAVSSLLQHIYKLCFAFLFECIQSVLYLFIFTLSCVKRNLWYIMATLMSFDGFMKFQT